MEDCKLIEEENIFIGKSKTLLHCHYDTDTVIDQGEPVMYMVCSGLQSIPPNYPIPFHLSNIRKMIQELEHIDKTGESIGQYDSTISDVKFVEKGRLPENTDRCPACMDDIGDERAFSIHAMYFHEDCAETLIQVIKALYRRNNLSIEDLL